MTPLVSFHVIIIVLLAFTLFYTITGIIDIINVAVHNRNGNFFLWAIITSILWAVIIGFWNVGA
jgi:hypothetical protein